MPFDGADAERELPRDLRVVPALPDQAQHVVRNATRIVDAGGPLGVTKRVSPEGVADTHNNLSGYVVIEAQSHAEAASLFEGHPHFSIFPGDAVEIMECLPIPGSS